MSDARERPALDLMMRFAERTGLVGERPQKRYLWTDAFAVCNFLALGREDLATHTIDCVHQTLGCSRDSAHPTRDGVRIGKPLPERGVDDAFDEELEWERDGQYFHYLTRWMHALDIASRRTGNAELQRWAIELATTAHRAFVYDVRGTKRMYWKMSIDLSRPLVASMGQHDPLDGFVTAVQLGNVPAKVIADYGSMLDPGRLATADALGLGGLLSDACRVQQLIEQGAWRVHVTLLDSLLDAALLGLRHFVAGGSLDEPAHRRLAFRELGLAIGLAGIELAGIRKLSRYVPLRTEIEAFWLDPASRRARTWTDHADINDVMLATSLVPAGFLELPSHSHAHAWRADADADASG